MNATALQRRVLLVGGTDAAADRHRHTLRSLGYDAIGPLRTDGEWRACDDLASVDVILVTLDRAAPGGGLEGAMSDPERYHDWPVVVVADPTPPAADPDAGSPPDARARFAHWTAGTSVFGYLHAPVSAATLGETVDLARRRHAECVTLTKRAEQFESAAAALEKALADRKLVDRAKSILIRRLGLTEDAAHRRLQSESQNRREPVVDVARRVIESDKVLPQG